MVVDPPQHKATIQTEAISGMERCGHRQRLAQGNDKRDTTQKNVQISRIGNAQTWIFIDPGPLKGINREPASVRLERIKQRGLIPAGGQKWRPIPLATQFLKQGIVNFD